MNYYTDATALEPWEERLIADLEADTEYEAYLDDLFGDLGEREPVFAGDLDYEFDMNVDPF